MSWQVIVEDVVGSVIGWVAFTGCGYVWAKRKLLPLYHRHVQEEAVKLASQRARGGVE